MPDNPIDIANADLLLSTTRSVRKRLDLDRPVPREVILECLRMAVQAPTASNGQGWRWMVVTDPGSAPALAELYGSTAPAVPRSGRDGAMGSDPQTIRVYKSALYLSTCSTGAGARDPVHRGPRERSKATCRARASTVDHAGGWSFMLALRARGLGSVWTTLHLQHEEEAAELLGIPSSR